MVSQRRVKIAGLSTYVPPDLLTNADLEKMVDTSDEWILQRTGIRERHIVAPGVATSDLAEPAALGAIVGARAFVGEGIGRRVGTFGRVTASSRRE